jgi:DNA-directed RNA polymerase subunit N (RpoN/RPB10)
MERINCAHCGHPIGAYIPLFNYLRQIADGTNSHTVATKKLLQNNNAIEYGSILNAFELRRHCCRSELFTAQVVKRWQGFVEPELK